MNEVIKRLIKKAAVPDAPQQIDLMVLIKVIAEHCASITYNTCEDGDSGAQAILYEFDVGGARNQK